MNVLIIDNYDSFTFNLYHIIEPMVKKIDVVRNDCIDFDKVKKYDKILLSPGPGLPSEASMLIPFIEEFHTSKSILGVCLGHQAIGEFFGCKLVNLKTVLHGDYTILDYIDKKEPLFKGLKNKIKVGHYHSWIIDSKHIKNKIRITSKSNQMIMSISHEYYDVKGVQFHPESILTPDGSLMMQNWLLD